MTLEQQCTVPPEAGKAKLIPQLNLQQLTAVAEAR